MIIRLPVPPSVNGLYRNRQPGDDGRRGRYKTGAYKDWLRDASAHLYLYAREAYLVREAIRAAAGKVVVKGSEITIRLPLKLRGDVSNRIKAVEDFLVAQELTLDDRHHHRVTCERKAGLECCEVEIIPPQLAV